jgi:hypothetical protein
VITLLKQGPNGEPHPDTHEGVIISACVMGNSRYPGFEGSPLASSMFMSMAPTHLTAEEIGLGNIRAHYARKERIEREWAETLEELHRRRLSLWEPALSRIPVHLRRCIRYLIPLNANLTGRSVLSLVVGIHNQARAAFIRAFSLDRWEQRTAHKSLFRLAVLGLVGCTGPAPPGPPLNRALARVLCCLAPRPPRHRLMPVLGRCVM